MFDEFIEVVTTREELDELADVLVRGCGCRYQDCELVSANPRCAEPAERRLRPQLESEESGRERDC